MKGRTEMAFSCLKLSTDRWVHNADCFKWEGAIKVLSFTFPLLQNGERKMEEFNGTN